MTSFGDWLKLNYDCEATVNSWKMDLSTGSQSLCFHAQFVFFTTMEAKGYTVYEAVL